MVAIPQALNDLISPTLIVAAVVLEVPIDVNIDGLDDVRVLFLPADEAHVVEASLIQHPGLV